MRTKKEEKITIEPSDLDRENLIEEYTLNGAVLNKTKFRLYKTKQGYYFIDVVFPDEGKSTITCYSTYKSVATSKEKCVAQLYEFMDLLA